MTMLHTKLMRDSVLRDKYDLQLSIHKPTDTAAVVLRKASIPSFRFYTQIFISILIPAVGGDSTGMAVFLSEEGRICECIRPCECITRRRLTVVNARRTALTSVYTVHVA